jgi:hypothetical protein
MATVHREPCPYDAGRVLLVTGREVYPYRPDLFSKLIWRCETCGAYTGCHPGTTKRVGRLANAETRALKVAAHDAFDALWKSGRMSRTKAYAWLRKQTGLPERDCHIGWMDDDMLRRAAALCQQTTEGHP